MRRHVVALLLILVFAAPNTFAADLRTSIEKAAKAESAREARALGAQPGPGGRNPYLMPSLGLMAGGAALGMFGLMHETGVKCESKTDANFYDSSFSCGTTHNKGLIIGGAAIAALGGFLMFKGQTQRTELQPRVGGFAVRHRISF